MEESGRPRHPVTVKTAGSNPAGIAMRVQLDGGAARYEREGWGFESLYPRESRRPQPGTLQKVAYRAGKS
jgi:hypothetical protein